MFSKKIKLSKVGEFILGTSSNDLIYVLSKTYPRYPDPNFPVNAYSEYVQFMLAATVFIATKQYPGHQDTVLRLAHQSIIKKLSDQPELSEVSGKLGDNCLGRVNNYIRWILDFEPPDFNGALKILSGQLIGEFTLFSNEQKIHFEAYVLAKGTQSIDVISSYKFLLK